MNSPVPIIGSLRVWSHESSPLRSPRDSDATPRQWQRTKRVEAQHAGVHAALHQLQRDVNRLRMRPQASDASGAFPFEIYQSGTWLQWACRTGMVIETGDPWTPDFVDTTFTLTSGVSRYWFWLDVETQEIKTSDTTLVWSARKIPIGYVDTSTYSAQQIAVHHNQQNWHITTLCP